MDRRKDSYDTPKEEELEKVEMQRYFELKLEEVEKLQMLLLEYSCSSGFEQKIREFWEYITKSPLHMKLHVVN